MKSMMMGLLGATLLLWGCSSDDEGVSRHFGPQGGGPGDQGKPPDPAAVCDPGKPYAGFAQTNLVDGRLEKVIGVDRGRVKPYSALTGEYSRVLGATPASLAGSGPTFGQPQPRWYSEPLSSAIAVYTAFSIAIDGCLTYTQTDAAYANAPDAASAGTVCAAMARKFWSRTPTPEEVASCVDVATHQTTSEPVARRRWAYTCASVLSAAGFLTY